MTAFSNLGEGFNLTRAMGEQMAANAKVAAERIMESGQEFQAQLAGQATGARDRLVACLDDLAQAPDAGTATQVGASYVTASMKAYGEDLTKWGQIMLQSYHRSMQGLSEIAQR